MRRLYHENPGSTLRQWCRVKTRELSERSWRNDRPRRPRDRPVHRGDYHVPKASFKGHDADMFGFKRIDWLGFPVRTLQNAQDRVQISPRIITVACFCAQHSPILGHAASSHTVTRSRSRIRRLVSP